MISFSAKNQTNNNCSYVSVSLRFSLFDFPSGLSFLRNRIARASRRLRFYQKGTCAHHMCVYNCTSIAGTKKTNASFCMRTSSEYKIVDKGAQRQLESRRVCVSRQHNMPTGDGTRRTIDERNARAQRQHWPQQRSLAMLAIMHVRSQCCFNRCFAWVDNKFVSAAASIKARSTSYSRAQFNTLACNRCNSEHQQLRWKKSKQKHSNLIVVNRIARATEST